jgi:tight adherence protein B
MKGAASTWSLLAAAIASASLAAAQTAGPPVFRSGVEAVCVDAFVSRSGQAVPGLQDTNFELKDNGVRQTLTLVAAESRPLTAVLVFDTSNSMAGERLAALRSAAEAFLDGLRPNDRAALIAFAHEIEWLAGPSADKAEVRSALGRLRAEGLTGVYDALYAGITLADDGVRPLVVLFTDGEDNVSILGPRQLEQEAERSNVLIHVVGWRPPTILPLRFPEAPASEQTRVLRRIAEITGGRFSATDSASRLRESFAAIADAMGHRYVLHYEPRGVTRQGWHRIELRLRGAKGQVQARRGYWVGR